VAPRRRRLAEQPTTPDGNPGPTDDCSTAGAGHNECSERTPHMKRVSSYLKMRVLGAIESAPGSTNVARIRHVSEQVFLDEDEQRFQFTWRTIQTWYSRYKKDGITTVKSKPRSDQGKTRKVTPEEVLEAIDQVRP